MLRKPIIGITTNERPNPTDDIPWSYAPTGFVQGVKKAGGIPLLLPIGTVEEAKLYVSMVDKILLIGGQNVTPEFYHEDNEATDDDFLYSRDVFEFAIIDEAIRQEKPIFSVCRGTQLMNVALGGNLNQDIENHWQDKPSDYLYHDMTVKEDSKLAQIYGHKTAINSFHHQSIKELSPFLDVIAEDPYDNTIEAVQSNHPDIHFLGVQWHPELLIGNRQADQELFDYFVNEL
ncbi:gamma-glutamyl-gamma-aminobutyrate hydrolase family protein [Streptococcus dentapri]|uniref:Gamma-glutamyl-gamma-aminobutyrate hydrolase family protein n=1 Tax=Streptococcus dentapri TaxID=573564 RepID=A0ABV8CZQ4_9STRE